MATYSELFGVKNDSQLQDKIAVACVVKADAIQNDATPPGNQAKRLTWAAQAMADPVAKQREMIWALIATNKDATLANILSATDASIQTAVDDAVDLFADQL